MAEIKTLISDIHQLFDNGFELQSDIEAFGQRLAGHLSKRAASAKGETQLRLSNLGTACDRKLWYMIKHPECGEKLAPDVRIKFLFGDLTEEILMFLAKEAGHEVTREQEEIEISGVLGHIDGFIDGHLVDCKSASSYSFQKFKTGLKQQEDAFGYLIQLGGYAYALGQKSASFFVIDKVSGHLCLDTHVFLDDYDFEKMVLQRRQMLAAKREPPRGFQDEPDGGSGNRKLGVVCSYCDFKKDCWPGLRTFMYRGGTGYKPTFFTKVVREPNVLEIK
jgi:hypothetical protein